MLGLASDAAIPVFCFLDGGDESAAHMSSFGVSAAVIVHNVLMCEKLCKSLMSYILSVLTYLHFGLINSHPTEFLVGP